MMDKIRNNGIKTLFKFEDKIKYWIENNPFKWGFLLIFISYGMGAVGVFALGINIRQGFFMGTIYASLLIILELNVRGER